MTAAPLMTVAGPLKWTCDGCDKIQFWTSTHVVYGSLKDQDESRWERLIVTCSDGCRIRLVADGRLPKEAEDGSKMPLLEDGLA